jgi:hypothetical protein
VDVLPDSRTRYRTGATLGARGETMVPVYCANCGKPWGTVKEKDCTFAFVLCQPCADQGIGDVAHLYQEPDSVFWERIANAQAEERVRGRFVPTTPEQLLVVLDDPSSVFSKLAEEWRAYVRKVTV